MLSRFHPIPERHGQTDEQTELVCQYCDKNRTQAFEWYQFE